MARKPAASPAKKQASSALQAAFLGAYAKTANISEAARAAKVSRSSHYEWLQDPDYERAFSLAHADACEALETEARSRAMVGVSEPVIYQGRLTYEPLMNPDGSPKRNDEGEQLYSTKPLTVRKKSDVLLIFLLKVAMPHKYRDSFKGEVKDLANAAARGADLFEALTDDELNSLETLTRAASERRRDNGGKTTQGA